MAKLQTIFFSELYFLLCKTFSIYDYIMAIGDFDIQFKTKSTQTQVGCFTFHLSLLILLHLKVMECTCFERNPKSFNDLILPKKISDFRLPRVAVTDSSNPYPLVSFYLKPHCIKLKKVINRSYFKSILRKLNIQSKNFTHNKRRS